jgi:hypothetical protein
MDFLCLDRAIKNSTRPFARSAAGDEFASVYNLCSSNTIDSRLLSRPFVAFFPAQHKEFAVPGEK